MLHLIKMTVSLTVSSSRPSKKFMLDKDLGAQLIIEWEFGVFRGLSKTVEEQS